MSSPPSTGSPPVTLEITVAPVDLPHAIHVLPHQLRQWAGQVDDIQFTLETHRSKGRYGVGDDERRLPLEALLENVCRTYQHAHVARVDYGAEMAAAVADRFFGGRPVPPKHHYGGPVYSYFYGWHVARHDLVLHMDSDMLFGGGSQTWTREAAALLLELDGMILCSPLPGPPTATGHLPDQVARRHSAAGSDSRREAVDGLAYSFGGASTRLFLMDRRQFTARLGPLPIERPRLASTARAIAEGHQPYELPEITISRLMRSRGLRRLDFLGSAPGVWSVHPALRSDLFHRELPRIIERIEAGDVPDAQRGDFDLNDSMIDWSSARTALRRQVWWRRLPRRWRTSTSGAATRSAKHRSD